MGPLFLNVFGIKVIPISTVKDFVTSKSFQVAKLNDHIYFHLILLNIYRFKLKHIVTK